MMSLATGRVLSVLIRAGEHRDAPADVELRDRLGQLPQALEITERRARMNAAARLT